MTQGKAGGAQPGAGGDTNPYMLLVSPKHTPGQGFHEVSKNAHLHSHSHLVNATERLWPVPCAETRRGACLTTRGHVLVIVRQPAAPGPGGAAGGAAGVAPTPLAMHDPMVPQKRRRDQLVVRQLYAAMWRTSMLYLFASERQCRHFFAGNGAVNEAVGYLDLEGVVAMRDVEVDIPVLPKLDLSAAAPSLRNGDDDAAHGAGTSTGRRDGTHRGTTERSQTGRSTARSMLSAPRSRPASASGRPPPPNARPPSLRPPSASAASASGSSRPGSAPPTARSTAASVASTRVTDKFGSFRAPTRLLGLELTTPQQTWTLYPDWRVKRQECLREVLGYFCNQTPSLWFVCGAGC